ncbi:hypothetical protein BAY61_18110 [Prauserella marina]|uniref:Uncharacterized protein n=1 Tax=Prauserella marina TaxID=530584 RepID=A0A222VRQ5_9PSEU|nr:hypothetical protein [Prauserella marina]ASR36597.1 hypothetical protein BAY61_18110 [Prauserella marina]PWV74006.1 hypothetical protein DES30_108180 [Prauserella marina]SDD60760.1 hypothetical protein SAMN05421630_110181 [Prauserella marina]
MSYTDTLHATGAPEVEYLIGDNYHATANRPLAEVAPLLMRDLLDVQGDDGIAPRAVFDVRADESGPVGVLRVIVSGMTRTSWESAEAYRTVVRDTIRSVFELASHYNRVEARRPDRARFILAIDLVSDSDKIVCGVIGTMHYTGQ